MPTIDSETMVVSSFLVVAHAMTSIARVTETRSKYRVTRAVDRLRPIIEEASEMEEILDEDEMGYAMILDPSGSFPVSPHPFA